MVKLSFENQLVIGKNVSGILCFADLGPAIKHIAIFSNNCIK